MRVTLSTTKVTMSMTFSRFTLILVVALFFVCFDNFTFFSKVISVYPFVWENIGFLISLAVVLLCVIMVVLLLVTNRYTLKPIIIVLLLISSFTNYFMQTYNVIIDETMIQNTLETNMSESLDLLTIKLFAYVFFLGILPSYIVVKMPIRYGTFKQELFTTLKGTILSLLMIVIMLFSFSKFYTSFFRENKPLRFYTNPTFYLYSAGKYVHDTFYSYWDGMQNRQSPMWICANLPSLLWVKRRVQTAFHSMAMSDKPTPC